MPVVLSNRHEFDTKTREIFMALPARRVTASDRIRYSFDKSMAAGPIALIGWLALISLISILLAALVLSLAGIHADDGDELSFGEAAWESLMRQMDSGAVGADHGWAFRLVMMLVTLAGLFVLSSLIGVLTSGLEGKMNDLRKGRSFVIERDHTLILGWSPSVFTIVSELVQANENRRAPRIVILADKDKVEMEEEIRDKVGATGNTRVICRTGNPIDLHDLEIANPHQARSIIILSPDEDAPDSHVIKSILALTNNPRRRPEPYRIVAEIRDARNMEAAHLVGRGETQFIQTDDIIARITVQTSQQSGISLIYTELLDYAGNEIYFKSENALTGQTYGEALAAYENSAVIGLCWADGSVKINPPIETVIGEGDKIIAVTADDDTILLSGLSAEQMAIDESAIRTTQGDVATAERTLILGWNARGCAIINELDSYVAPGSLVTVVADWPDAQADMTRLCRSLVNLTVAFQTGNTSDRATLDALDIPSHQHVIVLSYAQTMTAEQADARTLITLLHLRNIEEKSARPLSIVSEMLDVGTRELAEVTQADDFIVSDQLISLLLAQVSEDRNLNAVFQELFDSDGAEIYLKPASDYVELNYEVNFYTITEAALRHGESAIGYRIMAHAGDSARQYGVVINPTKSETVSFGGHDRIIVVAES